MNGGASALVLYPASKLVWASDSAAKNFLPINFPQPIRTPVMGMLLAMLTDIFPDNYWTEKAGEMIMASAVVQTVQQFDTTIAGQPGSIDASVNKFFEPLAKMGMTGYTERLRGYVTKPNNQRGYTTMKAGAVASQFGGGSGRPGAWVVKAGHPNDVPMRGGRGGRMRGFVTEHFKQ